MSKQIDWGDASGDKISVEASEFSGNQVLRVTSQQNTRAYKRSIAIVVTSSSDPTKKATINLSQEAAPATLSLNVQSLVFSQRADSLEVQLTTNDNWQTSSNDEIPIPDEVTLKYNPWTDMVEMVGQPQQVYDAVQASDDYVMALVRIGYSNVERSLTRRDIAFSPTSVNTLMDPRTGGYKDVLFNKMQDRKYQRIIPRAYMREPGEVLPNQGFRDNWHPAGQASLFGNETLINKPGKKVNLRGCQIKYPTSLKFILSDGPESDRRYLSTTNTNGTSVGVTKATVLQHVSAVKFITGDPKSEGRRFEVPFTYRSIDSRSSNGPIGYILYKKKGTSGYVVRGFDAISNFALARIWLDDNPIISQDGLSMIAKAHFGDL